MTIVLAALLSTAAAAQPCPTQCPSYLRDKNGCCSRTAVEPHTPGRLFIRANQGGARARIDGGAWFSLPAEKSVSSDVHRVEVEREGASPWTWQILVRPGERVELDVTLCAPGMYAAATGLCCWWGQSAQQGRCVGTPQCGSHLVATATGCEPARCAEGAVRVEGGACCWPGQRWNDELHRCVGEPSRCPAGTVALFSRCVAPSDQRDEDQDGVPTSVDDCFNHREDKDGFADHDGCPDPDNDQDRIADAADRCPNEPEDYDRFEDQDGCPEPDNDRDGFPDVADKCPDVAEDKDGFQDDDGCLDPDDDSDGVPDTADKCQGQLESPNGYLDDDGCRDALPPVVELPRLGGPIAWRYGLGVAFSGPMRIIRGRNYGDVGPSPSMSVLARHPLGIEAGFMGQWPPAGLTEGTGSFLLGASPVRVGTWLGRYGGNAVVLAEPFVHLVASPGYGFPGFQLGNRISYRGESTWSLSVAYETGRESYQEGLRLGLEVEPNPEYESLFLGGFGLLVDAGLFLAFDAPQGRQIGFVGRGIATYRGLGAGLGFNTAGYLTPIVELSPIRLGGGQPSLRVAPYFEPIVQFTWYGYGPGTLVGLRLVPTSFLMMTLGIELGPGPTPAAFITTFGAAWGGFSKSAPTRARGDLAGGNTVVATDFDSEAAMERAESFGRIVTGEPDPVQAAKFSAGQRVRCRWKAGSTSYSGVVSRVDSGWLLIDYDDGDVETISPSLCTGN